MKYTLPQAGGNASLASFLKANGVDLSLGIGWEEKYNTPICLGYRLILKARAERQQEPTAEIAIAVSEKSLGSISDLDMDQLLMDAHLAMGIPPAPKVVGKQSRELRARLETMQAELLRANQALLSTPRAERESQRRKIETIEEAIEDELCKYEVVRTAEGEAARPYRCVPSPAARPSSSRR